MNANILIIGNGFDLYHELPTKYIDFLSFAKHWSSFYSTEMNIPYIAKYLSKLKKLNVS